jgi:hypothetical protein
MGVSDFTRSKSLSDLRSVKKHKYSRCVSVTLSGKKCKRKCQRNIYCYQHTINKFLVDADIVRDEIKCIEFDLNLKIIKLKNLELELNEFVNSVSKQQSRSVQEEIEEVIEEDEIEEDEIEEDEIEEDEIEEDEIEEEVIEPVGCMNIPNIFWMMIMALYVFCYFQNFLIYMDNQTLFDNQNLFDNQTLFEY